jgi:hypothetical protein
MGCILGVVILFLLKGRLWRNRFGRSLDTFMLDISDISLERFLSVLRDCGRFLFRDPSQFRADFVRNDVSSEFVLLISLGHVGNDFDGYVKEEHAADLKKSSASRSQLWYPESDHWKPRL